MAVLEAMAAGLPVVVTEACNLPEVAEWNAGRVIQEAPSALSETLKELTASPQLRETCGVNARRLVQAKFTWRNIAHETVKCYKEIAR